LLLGWLSLALVQVDDTADLVVSPRSVTAGDRVTVSGSGFHPGATIALELAHGREPPDRPLLSTEARADMVGAIEATLTIPEDTEPDTYAITASGPAMDERVISLRRFVAVTIAPGAMPGEEFDLYGGPDEPVGHVVPGPAAQNPWNVLPSWWYRIPLWAQAGLVSAAATLGILLGAGAIRWSVERLRGERGP
jgi:hypothetical protein